MFSRSEIGLEMHTIFDAIRVMEDNLIALTIILYRHLQKVIALCNARNTQMHARNRRGADVHQ